MVTYTNFQLSLTKCNIRELTLYELYEQTFLSGTLHRKKMKEMSFKESLPLLQGQSFSFEDILEEVVFYSHDGSKANKDFMEIIVSVKNNFFSKDIY